MPLADATITQANHWLDQPDHREDAAQLLGKILEITATYAYYSADRCPVVAGRPYSTSKAWIWLDLKL